MRTASTLKSVILVIVVLMCFCALAWLDLTTTKVMPDINWKLSGKVIDSRSNGVPDVIIRAAGPVNVTALNKIFRTKPEEFRKTITTDKDGNFTLQCISYGFDVLFQKDGYADFETNFAYYPDVPGGTDRVFTVQLREVQK